MYTHFIPLKCIIHNTIVAFTQNKMKKSTVSARNLWTGEGMVYSRPSKTTQIPFMGYKLVDNCENVEAKQSHLNISNLK